MDIASYMMGKNASGGGGDITIKPLTVTENGTYSEQGVAYSPVRVDVKDWLDQEFTDGKTRLFIELTEPNYLSPVIVCSLNGKIKVDWGDGTIEEVTDNKGVTGGTYIPHTYNTVGKYIIVIELISGEIRGMYVSSTNIQTGIFTDRVGSITKTVTTNLYMTSLLRADITYPSLVDGGYSINYPSCNGMFFNSVQLRKVTIPNGSKRIASTYFAYTTITECNIPNSVVIIGANAFLGCAALKAIKIPSSVTQISAGAFANNLSCTVYDFTEFELTDGALPIIFESNIFQAIPTGAKILFATEEIANVAKQTTNLVQYASYIHYVGEE